MLRTTILFQAAYYVVTGVWPLVSMSTFEAVTGPKTDDWLVNTVGALATAIGITLAVGARRPSRETCVLSCCAALAFISIDLVYALQGTISQIYMLDAAVQIAILCSVSVGMLLVPAS